MHSTLSRVGGVGAMLFIFVLANSPAVAALPSAPVVPPAPMVDKPLTPVGNDIPADQPSVQHAWVPGHWRWNEGAYVWEAGRWEIPPAANLVWHAPEWQQQANGYVLREGFWDVAPPPTVAVAPQVVQAQPVQQIVITTPPPPPQHEVIYERPSATHVWVSGYWAWRGGRHVWTPGHWTLAPRSNAVWVAPRWEQRGGSYVFIDGYWRDSVVVATPPPAQAVVVAPPAPPQQVVVVAAPPAPRQEVVYARPGPGYLWVPGYWGWNRGRHVWVAGHYELPPRGRSAWVEPRWDRRGGSYIFIEGHWR